METEEKKKEKKKGLTPKWTKFKDEYLLCLNATEAYMRVYTKATRASAAREGSRLLKNPYIWDAIDKEMAKQTMESSEILRRLTDIAQAAFFPFIEIQDDGFVFFNFSHPDAKNYIHVIKRIKSTRSRRVEMEGTRPIEWEDERVEVELHDAMAALVQIGKYRRMFGEKEVNFNIDLSKLTANQLQRLRDGENVISVITNPG